MKYITLTKGVRAKVDDSDYLLLADYSWYLDSRGYATRYSRGKYIGMHRMVNDTPDGMLTDHINGDRLDNRKSNLRTCTRAQNGMNRGKQRNNTTGHKGVYSIPSDRWRAQITFRGKRINIGTFDEIDDAISAHRATSKKYFGSYAKV